MLTEVVIEHFGKQGKGVYGVGKPLYQRQLLLYDSLCFSYYHIYRWHNLNCFRGLSIVNGAFLYIFVKSPARLNRWENDENQLSPVGREFPSSSTLSCLYYHRMTLRGTWYRERPS